jgi:hypothetical protein
MEGEEEEKERQVSHTRHDRLSINSEATLNLDSAHAGASELEPDVCLLFLSRDLTSHCSQQPPRGGITPWYQSS